MAESEEELKSLLMRVKEESEKYSHLFKNFPQFVVIHTLKDFGKGENPGTIRVKTRGSTSWGYSRPGKC